MAVKNFKDKKPLDTVGGEIEQNSKDALLKKKENTSVSSKKKSDYLRLDISNYREYLSTMAGFKRISLTKYIQHLIDNDIKQYSEIYEKLKNIQNE